MPDKSIGAHIGMEIQRMLVHELGDFGVSIFKKQCAEVGIKPENIKVNDLVLLSQKMIHALRPVLGNEKAQKVGKDIQKLKVLIELQELAGKTADPSRERKELDAYARLGSICYTVGDWDDAIEYFQKVLNMAKPLNNQMKASEAHRILGHIYKRRSEWDDATLHFQKGLKIAETLKSPAGIADALGGMGYVCWRRGDYAKAREHYTAALRNALESKDKSMIGVIHIETGLVYSDLGDHDKAIAEYNNSIELLQASKEYQQLSRAYNNLGDIYLQREDWAQAIKQFDLCRKNAEVINHRMMIGWSLFNSAEALAKSGNPDEAIARCTQALVTLEKLNDFVGLCSAHRDLGLAYGMKKDWGASESHFRISEEILGKINSPFNRAHLYMEWGQMLAYKGDKKKARDLLQKAADTFQKLGAKLYHEKTQASLVSLK